MSFLVFGANYAQRGDVKTHSCSLEMANRMMFNVG